MPIDPDLEVVLKQVAALRLKPLHESTVEEARAAMTSRPRPPGEEVHQVTELTIETPVVSLPARLYRPSAERLPLLVFFHGGGWVLGNLDSHDATCRALANRAHCAVLSVTYRLAPEHRFPAAADDATEATRWALGHADELGLDPSRVAVGGDSAGGNLAAVVARRFRDSGQSSLVAQLLIYPVTDHDFDRPSMRDQRADNVLTIDSMRWFWDHYVGEDGDPLHPDASPIRAADLSGLPPAIVVTAELDPLRDEGDDYARALAGAGVPVQHVQAEGMTHGFVGMAAAVPKAAAYVEEIGQRLRATLEPAGK